MNSDLHSRVTKALELASRATPGEWQAFDNYIVLPDLGCAISLSTGNPSYGDSYNDSAFIAASHTHVDLIRDLYAALLASEEARGKAEVDAGRYRWLRNTLTDDGYWTIYFPLEGTFDLELKKHDPFSISSAEGLDKAIDAAIQGESK